MQITSVTFVEKDGLCGVLRDRRVQGRRVRAVGQAVRVRDVWRPLSRHDALAVQAEARAVGRELRGSGRAGAEGRAADGSAHVRESADGHVDRRRSRFESSLVPHAIHS